jgi:divinyl chlorophyllide a 8-vinyl-reductase
MAIRAAQGLTQWPGAVDTACMTAPAPRLRIALAGATGTIGRAVAAELVSRGYDLVCLVRAGTTHLPDIPNATFREVDFARANSIGDSGLASEPFDAIISCRASRTGAPKDAWAIDHDAHVALLSAAQSADIGHFILLSAICVQKPKLAFQHAKLAFEARLIESGIRYSIVRPTAFFKSLSGQIDRVLRGKPFLLFGDGTHTACKPISDRDLATYIADCLIDRGRWDRILPIGGPGPAITPRQQGEALFQLTGQPAQFRSVPVGLLGAIVALLSGVSRVIPSLAAKAEYARIGRYYATESMLLLNPATGRYDAAATPESGQDTLWDHYRSVIEEWMTTQKDEQTI